MEAVAHTLVYDCVVSEAASVQLLAFVNPPTLVLDSQGTSDDLTTMAAIITKALPNSSHRSLSWFFNL